MKLLYGTVDRCSARFAISCKDAVKAPDSGLTATTIAACMAALPGASCDDVIYRKVTACAIKGTRGNGLEIALWRAACRTTSIYHRLRSMWCC